MTGITKIESGIQYQAECVFQKTPKEIKIEIFKFLPISELANAAKVCKDWYQLTKEPKLPLVQWLIKKEQAICDIIWLRNLPNICNRAFNYKYVVSNKNPFVERSALLIELSKDEQNDRRAAFSVAAEHGNIQIGKFLLPFVPERDWVIPAAFSTCLDRAQPDFARWLVSTNPVDVVDLTGITTIKVKCDIGYGNNLFLHGEGLNRFLTSSFYFFSDGGFRYDLGNWNKGLPMRYKEEKVEEGKAERYWEIVLLWNHSMIWGGPFPVPSSAIPYKPVIHTAEGSLKWSEGDNFTLQVGTSTEIYPHF